MAEGAAGETGQLFVRAPRQVLPGFAVNEHEAAIAAICRQVEGMPLALELAARWVRVMPCEEIARQITHNPELLADSVRNLPDRHPRPHLFNHSWRLLTLAEQQVLRRVSAFQGGWTLAEAHRYPRCDMAPAGRIGRNPWCAWMNRVGLACITV